MLHTSTPSDHEPTDDSIQHPSDLPTAFSLERFLPLLEERINVLNPFTRSFLVAWITLLDSIPDLELIAHLPRFLGGLFKFLSDSNQDVYTMTQVSLDRFLNEIKKIARIKKGIAESKKSHSKDDHRRSSMSIRSEEIESEDRSSTPLEQHASVDDTEVASGESGSISGESEKSVNGDGDWVPGQDVVVDHPKILEIVVGFLSIPSGKLYTIFRDHGQLIIIDPDEEQNEIVLTALRWIDSFFAISPEDIMPFVPSLLSNVLPRMSHEVEGVCQAAIKVNGALMDYIMSLSEDSGRSEGSLGGIQLPPSLSELGKELTGTQRRDSNLSGRLLKTVVREQAAIAETAGTRSPTPAEERGPSPRPIPELDYQAAVSALTLQFLNEHEATRVAAIAWLIMLHRMAPGKVGTVQSHSQPSY